MVMSPSIAEWLEVTLVTSTVLRTLAVGQRGWIRSCLARPSDFSGDSREWRHFEWVFRNWFGFLYDTAEEWLDQAANSPVELGEAVPDRRETDKALYMSLAMVCKNEALDVVKTVTHKRGFESWRRLSKEYGVTTGTSLHEYTTLEPRTDSRRDC